MKFRVVVAVIVSMWTAGALYATHAAQSAPAGATTWSGVYTAEQAKLGSTAYVKHCSECHGEDFAGNGEAPPLKGPELLSNWNGLSVGEFFDRIRISMPPSNPDDVTVKEKVEIIAYLLQENGFPAGTSELPATLDALKAIKFESNKPGR